MSETGMPSATIVITKPAKRRRGFRVSLRLFMLIVVASGVWLGWLANGARTQRLAVAEIRRQNNGGTVMYAEEMGSTPASAFRLKPTLMTPVQASVSQKWLWLKQELGQDYFDSIVVVRMNSPNAAKMAALRKLPRLRVLELINTKDLREADWSSLKDLERLELLVIYFPVTNAAVQHLAGMPRLRTLTLGAFPLDEAAFLRLGDLTQLQMLALAGGSKFQDRWLAHLAGMDALRELFLPSSTIGDEGLIHLRKLSSLKTVDLRATRVTQDGVDKLKQAMPGLKVRFP